MLHVGLHLTPQPRLMSEANRGIRVLYFNIAKNYTYLDVILDQLKDDFDVLCIQEPPWQLIRRAPSAKNPEGEEVMGAPINPAWTMMVRHPGNNVNQRPRVLTYVTKRLSSLRPAMRRDLVDHRDIMIISLFYKEEVIHLANIYSDDEATVIQVLRDKAQYIPALSMMGGGISTVIHMSGTIMSDITKEWQSPCWNWQVNLE